MAAKILTLTLAIRLKDIPEAERLNLAADLDTPATALPTLERTSPVRIAEAVAMFLNRSGADIEVFSPANVYAEIDEARVVSAAYD